MAESEWAKNHRDSERLAGEAESVIASFRAWMARRGRLWDENKNPCFTARDLYRRAAASEEAALLGVPDANIQTRGITAVRAVNLWLKAGRRDEAERSARRSLRELVLPPSARGQLEALLADAGIFGPGEGM